MLGYPKVQRRFTQIVAGFFAFDPPIFIGFPARMFIKTATFEVGNRVFWKLNCLHCSPLAN